MGSELNEEAILSDGLPQPEGHSSKNWKVPGVLAIVASISCVAGFLNKPSVKTKALHATVGLNSQANVGETPEQRLRRLTSRNVFNASQPRRNVANDVKDRPKMNEFAAGLCLIPHQEKQAKGGEDSCAVTSNMIAVADGVGGWAEIGVDPAFYSRKLCANIERLALEASDARLAQPGDILVDAARGNMEKGSSTSVICTLDRSSPVLYTANLGDSGYMLLRWSGLQELKQVYRSKEQQHSFNFPFQVGTGGDDPATAVVRKHEVRNGDILVVGSDGLFDNLFDSQIINMLRQCVTAGLLDNPQQCAELISQEAERFSHKTNWRSPFATLAEVHSYNFPGGKPDDITVVVAQLKVSENTVSKL